ncbi:tyrosine-type recombinase/integrase [Flavobacterium macrobrachii]|uniref:Site-specific integrase n=1 Tax=Flavobacterium macrobrachii TaxID=591204 RepID=A0ABS2CXT9_9FLAO|nr:site-specific integrase [Flavobacterium macrobrachii]MBM6498985.1 site-specific integrase [Flavobacterium macrobrachii]
MPTKKTKIKGLISSSFVNYKAAELRIKTQWLVVYYAKNPFTKEMQRFRVVVPSMKSETERIKHGKKIRDEINKKLAEGWSPFSTDTFATDFKTYDHCKEKFLELINLDIKKGLKRQDTERTYKSNFSMIELFAKRKKQKLNFIFELNRVFIVNYLDFILYDRNNTHRTYNNHLNFIKGFLNFCVTYGFLSENFAIGIAKKKEGQKIRQLLDTDVKSKIKSIEDLNFHYYALCMTTYFCFIRRTELSKLLVRHVDILNSTITIPSEISKNKNTETITIPKSFLPIISKHINFSNLDDFLFSTNDFKSGKNQLNPKKVSDTWEKFRKLLKISKVFQFYSLKDTGITDLLNSGVPSIKVRNQARHSELATTEKYTHRNVKCDEVVQNANFDF